MAGVWPPDAGCLHFHAFSSRPLHYTLPGMSSQQAAAVQTGSRSCAAGPQIVSFHRGAAGPEVPRMAPRWMSFQNERQEKRHAIMHTHLTLNFSWAKTGECNFRPTLTSSLRFLAGMNFFLRFRVWRLWKWGTVCFSLMFHESPMRGCSRKTSMERGKKAPK